uniref:IRG-type G domain-containing protein n=1 Tax=Alexandrium monilatum TaxID=311494 RepID=A0A7S4Q6U7_9DINO
MAATLANIIRGGVVAAAGVFTVNADAVALGKDIAMGKTTAAPAHAPKVPSPREVALLKKELEQARMELVQWKEEWPSVMETATRRKEELDRREAQLRALEEKNRLAEEEAKSCPMPEFLAKVGYEGTVNVAVVGNSGVGKSLLINTVRGVKRTDPTWAPVGVNETTTEPRMYEYPGDARTRLWDLAGAGSPKCPRDNYIRTIGLRYFDVVLVLSATRFTETEIALLAELRSYGVPNFVVRTKLDTDIDNNESDYGRSPEETKQGILEDLRKRGVTSPYLINSRELNAYDFPRLLTDVLRTIHESRGLSSQEPAYHPGKVPQALTPAATSAPLAAASPARVANGLAAAVQAASAVVQRADDCPGLYVITHDNIKVSPQLALGADQTSMVGIQRLAVGTIISVVEVVSFTEAQRVRGRIEDPPGWISLMNTSNGYRWAEKLAAREEPEPS